MRSRALTAVSVRVLINLSILTQQSRPVKVDRVAMQTHLRASGCPPQNKNSEVQVKTPCKYECSSTWLLLASAAAASAAQRIYTVLQVLVQKSVQTLLHLQKLAAACLTVRCFILLYIIATKTV